MDNTFKRQVIFVMLMLLGCFYAKADDGLITKQITIKLDEAGTLPGKIGSSQKYKITNLKIIGDINGTDIRLIRNMAGCSDKNQKTSGELSTLDLSEARIVEGGNCYYVSYGGKYYTSPDEIGDLVFDKCEKLTTITLPTNVTKIGWAAFSCCTGLTSINISEGVTEIGEYAFSYCTGLTSINIPESVTEIGYGVFHGCTGLISINIPKGVTNLRGTFANCTGLTSINIPGSVTNIGENAFFGCTGLTTINIPGNVTSIGNYAFNGCTGLTSINISEGVTEIGENAFFGCTGLTSINIPKSVKNIGYESFKGCTGLTSINIHEGVTKIGDYAFRGCTGLTSIYTYSIIPVSVNFTTFDGVGRSSCTLYVPTGSYQYYSQANEWKTFKNIVEFAPATGIKYITTLSEVTETSRYTLDGQKLNAPASGMNIVKYSDGTVKKVVVK